VRKPTHVDVQTLAFEVAEINPGKAAISKLLSDHGRMTSKPEVIGHDKKRASIFSSTARSSVWMTRITESDPVGTSRRSERTPPNDYASHKA